MGVFDIFMEEKSLKDGDKRPKKLTKSIVKKSESFPDLLKDVINDFNLIPSSIDFDILAVVTQVKMPEESDYEEINPRTFEPLQDKSLLLNPEFTIKQSYNINFRPVLPEKEIDLKLQISVDKFYTRAIGIIRKESELVWSDGLEKQILHTIRKRMLRSGMFIDIFDLKMRKTIRAIVSKIRVNGALEEDVKFEICHWATPVPTTDDNLIFHYKEKNSTQEKAPTEVGRVNYAERGFVTAVDQNELLMEYQKPLMGRSGRDFRGRFIETPEPKVSYPDLFKVDQESVMVKESEKALKFYAKREGYVFYDEKILAVSDTLQIDKANFKATGNIHAGIDKNVSIKIKGDDITEDQIGPNTVIEAHELIVGGSVANKAHVKAEKLEIKGMTHGTSIIEAKDAKINTHRGKLTAKSAVIERVENGVVEAEEVKVGTMLGGTIRAQRIEIEVLYSNAVLVASEEIAITQKLMGGENRLFIESSVVSKDKNRLRELLSTLRKLEKESVEKKKMLVGKRRQIEGNNESLIQIKNHIAEEKRAGRQPLRAYVEKYKLFVKIINEAKELRDDIETMESKVGKLHDELTLIQDSVIHAKIKNSDIWRNFNEITYRLVDPPQEISFVPPEDADMPVLRLEMVGLDEYEIVADS